MTKVKAVVGARGGLDRDPAGHAVDRLGDELASEARNCSRYPIPNKRLVNLLLKVWPPSCACAAVHRAMRFGPK
jgi:hypothetical protein